MMKSFIPLLIALALTSPANAGEWVTTYNPSTSISGTLPKFIGNVVTGAAKSIPSGLPDGRMAKVDDGDIQRAWYEVPTRRYAHGVIGDAIEAGALVVRDGNFKRIRLDLPQNLVFEDRYPRLVDLDGDGSMEVVTILSDASKGAAIAIYKVIGGGLVEIARTPHIGISNRWRNIAGFGDYLGDGTVQFMEVVTPHIGGTLNLWSFKGGKLRKVVSAQGFSNHFIGSRELELSVSHDFDGDGLLDVAVPSRDRRSLRIMRGKTLKEIGRVKLPGKVRSEIKLIKPKGKLAFVVKVTGYSGEFVIKRAE